MVRRLLLQCTLAAMLLLTSGCGSMSVGHYDRNLWLEDTPQMLSMRFWNFSYECHSVKEGLGIRATATPKNDSLPEWAHWYDQLQFTAYISDTAGTVLANATTELLPRPTGRANTEANGIPLEFLLTPPDYDGPLFITFGYTMRLSEERWKQGTPRGKVRLVKEGALSQ